MDKPTKGKGKGKGKGKEIKNYGDDVHHVMYYSPMQCKNLLDKVEYKSDTSNLHGCTIDDLRNLRGIEFLSVDLDSDSPDTEVTISPQGTKQGLYWASWIECKLLVTNNDRLQPRDFIPAYLDPDLWPTWKHRTMNKGERTNQVKIPMATATYRVKYPNDIIPKNLGKGSSISHLCDKKCINPDHIAQGFVHQDNMDRQRCLGMTLLVVKDTIVQEIPCIHPTCCTRIRVLYLNDSAIDYIKKNN